MTKVMAAILVYTTKESNYNSIVIVHQHGGDDVTCKPRCANQYLFTASSQSKASIFEFAVVSLVT